MCPYELMTRKKEKMSMELFKKIIDDAVTLGIREVTLSFYNEPLLDDLLFDRVRYAKSKGMKVGFFSNGTLNRNAEILESGVDFITFSFDGETKETYENIRRGANFEKVIENIRSLIKEKRRRGLDKPYITVSLRVQKENFSEVKDFIKLWADLADNVHIGPTEDRRREKPRMQNCEIVNCVFPCWELLGISKLYVMSNGKVTVCCQDYDGKLVVGDLTKQSIQEVWNSEKFQRIRKLHLSGKGDLINFCRNCEGLYTGAAWWAFLVKKLRLDFSIFRYMYFRLRRVS